MSEPPSEENWLDMPLRHAGFRRHKSCCGSLNSVRLEFRRQKVATKILAELLKGNERCIIGILSSHPATILATLRACGKELEDFSFDIARAFAAEVMASCPVDYVRWAKSVGQIFEGNAPEVVSCSANTYFFVDHAKPTQVLAAVKESHGVWTFGDLPEGHEFLALMDVGPDKGRLAYYDSDAIDGYWEEIRRLARQCTGIRYTAAMRNSS